MDGQHTTEGCILLNGGEDRPILCKVYTGLMMEQEALRHIVEAWEGRPDSFRAAVLRGVMYFVQLYHGQYSAEQLVCALSGVHPMELYRISRDNPAKLPGWRRYVSARNLWQICL